MAQLCFLTTCMGRLEHLERTLGRIVGQQDSTCVVVDYSCPDRSGDWVAAHHPGVQVVRLPSRTSFDHSLAANAGSRFVDAGWICFCDCDILFDPAFAAKVLPHLEPGHYYCPEPIRDWALCGTFICSREDFERIGGYDEIYRGWGERDFDVFCALELAGIERRSFPSRLLRHIPHGEQSRVRFHDTKERHLVQSINRIYRFVKFDVVRATGAALSREVREDLYEKVAEKTRAAIHEGKPLGLVFDIPGGGATLRYEIRGTRGRRVSKIISLVHRSPFANRLYRFIKANLLRRSLDLTHAIHGRHLPFGLRLELHSTPEVLSPTKGTRPPPRS
jgi:hypothetical protein